MNDLKEEFEVANMVANRYAKKFFNANHERDDLVSVALLRIAKYKDNFDPTKGMKYRTYLYTMAWQAINKYILKRANDLLRQAKNGTALELEDQESEDYGRHIAYNHKVTKDRALVGSSLSSAVVTRSTQSKDRWRYEPDKECEEKDQDKYVHSQLKALLSTKEYKLVVMSMLQQQDFTKIKSELGLTQRQYLAIRRRVRRKLIKGYKD